MVQHDYQNNDRVFIENGLDQKYIISGPSPRVPSRHDGNPWLCFEARRFSEWPYWGESEYVSKHFHSQLKQHCFDSTSKYFYSKLKTQLKQHCFNSTSKSGLKVEQCWRCNSPTLDGRVQCSFRETRQHVQVILSSMTNTNTNTTTETKTNTKTRQHVQVINSSIQIQIQWVGNSLPNWKTLLNGLGWALHWLWDHLWRRRIDPSYSGEIRRKESYLRSHKTSSGPC